MVVLEINQIICGRFPSPLKRVRRVVNDYGRPIKGSEKKTFFRKVGMLTLDKNFYNNIIAIETKY